MTLQGVTFDQIINALSQHGCKPAKRGSGYTALCPAHDDHAPSLDIDERNGKVLTICRSHGCSFESILNALGLKGIGYEPQPTIPYHVRKGVKVHAPAYLDKDNLIIPLIDMDGKQRGKQTIWSEQRTIDGNLTDKITKGKGKNEYFFLFGNVELSDSILIATGYATTASIHESTGSPAVMSMDDGSLPHTVSLFRNRYPEKEIIICCDYDAVDKMKPVAVQHNARLCYPVMDGMPKADFNDLMVRSGKSAVCDVIGDARFVAPSESPTSRLESPTSDAAPKGKERPAQQQHAASARIMTAKELWDKEFKPVKWLVNNVLPEGVTLLVSPPKIGKTRLAMQLAIAIASDGYALNHAETRVNKTSVLFLALESGDRRAQKDMKQMIDSPPDGLHIVTTWPRFNEGGAAELEWWLDRHPDCHFVTIDTTAKVRDRNHGGNGFMYTVDYEAGSAIKEIADRRGISILLLHHANKKDCEGGDILESVSGSTGVTGSVDHILLLKRNRLEPDGLMTLISRDHEDRQFAMTFEDGLWTLIGDPEDAAGDGWRGDGKSDARHEILSALRQEPLKPAELATRIGKNATTTRRLLQKLSEAGQVTKRFDGKYSVV